MIAAGNSSLVGWGIQVRLTKKLPDMVVHRRPVLYDPLLTWRIGKRTNKKTEIPRLIDYRLKTLRKVSPKCQLDVVRPNHLQLRFARVAL